MIIVGIFISLLLKSITNHKNQTSSEIWDYVCSIVITFLVWEGNLRLDNYFNNRLPWQKSVLKRVLIQLLTSVPYTIGIIYFSLNIFNKYVCQYPEEQHSFFLIPSISIGLTTSIIILSLEISSQFFKNWKKSLIEIEKHKAESAQIQLQNLKNQINPHFLFNNLSVLSSLVYIDQDKAVDFINQLSKVYRYVLENRESELSSLENEITFINSYFFLLQIRFDKNIQFSINVSNESKQLLLPPMSLQILVENAIKHNEISAAKKLTILIETKDNYIVVSNNLQLRSNQEPSSKIGLQNIKDRYAYFTENEIEIIPTSENFTVKLPLLARI